MNSDRSGETSLFESEFEVYNALSHDMIKGHSELYTAKKNDISLQTEPQHQDDTRVWL